MATADVLADKRHWFNYRTIWRWHFYAGVFCIPFVLWLATTGSIYLFRPQIEAFLDRPYAYLPATGTRAVASAQVEAALASVPGSNLHYYQLPESDRSAVQIIVGRKADEFRVYVAPFSLRVLKVVNEDDRLMRRAFHLHGELLMGDRGSWIVETAASWTIVMILTGLYLWWPRNVKGLAGVLYPRLRQGSRLFWRDIHAVTGMWVSGLALVFLLSGLPWAKSWGGYLKMARKITGNSSLHQDWTTGRSSEIAQRLAMNNMLDEHAAHRSHMDMVHSAPNTYAALDNVLPSVARLHLAFPVLVSSPAHMGGPWGAKSDSQDRILRDQVTLDPETGAVLSRIKFNQRPWIDRVVGIGAAMHEGHLYGWMNQLVNLCTAIGLVLLCTSALVMWWRRRPHCLLGAPVKQPNTRLGLGLAGLICGLALYLPLFGITLVITISTEHLLLRRIPATRLWLGLGYAEKA